MARPRPWFRIHNTIVDNPKIQRLPDRLVRPWLNLVALANANGGVLPSIEDVSFRMRQAVTKCETLIETFLELRLFDKTPEGISPHDWNDWQYQSDVSTERVQQFRKRQRNVSVTVNETDQRQSRDRAETETLPKGSVERPPKSKGTRLALDWKPSQKNYTAGTKLNLLTSDVDTEADAFREHFHGPDAKQPVKKDWDGAFNGWLRRGAADIVRRRSWGKPNTSGAHRGSVSAARDSILVKAGVFPGDGRQQNQGLQAERIARPSGNPESIGDSGTVIDADFRERSARPSDGIEGSDPTASGADDTGHGDAVGGVPETCGDLPGGRGAACFDNTADREPLVARMAGVER